MILEFKDWTISTLAGPLGYQLDNDTRKLTLQGDLPAGWTWDVLVEAGDNSDIWLLTPTEDGASITLTDENLSIRGAYYLQVRGTRGSQVKHCNVVTAYVLRTLAGTADWPTLPTEFAQAEQNIKELNAHPPIPGENGYWLLWDLAESAYRESQLPVPVGPAGPANTLTIGTVETLAPGQPATAQITGEAPNQTLSLGIPQGKTGQTGATPALSMGQVETLEPGEPATAELTGTPEAPVLSLGIPEGQPGKDGPANTLLIGTVETLAPGQPATAQITGEAPNQTLSLGIPQGETGPAGATPELSMGTVETLEPGEPATAELTGTPEAPVLSLGIPQGQPGKDGVQLNDSAVNTTEAWSSKKIHNALRQIDPYYMNKGTFGVQWDMSNPLSALTRLTQENDPNGYVTVDITTEPVAAVGSGEGSSPFDNYFPWKGMEEFNVVDGDPLYKQGEEGFSRSQYDTMVFIPEFWYHIEQEGDITRYYISSDDRVGFKKHPGSGRYVGRYTASEDYKSISGVASLVSITRATARENASAKGPGWSQYDYASYCAICLLYLVEFADFNSQMKLGYGWVSATAATNTGGTDSMLYHTGSLDGQYGHTAVQYRHIENPFGNVSTWADGINMNNENVYVCTDPSKYADDTSDNYTFIGTRATSDGYVKKISVPSGENNWCMFPTEVGASSTTYLCDYSTYDTGWRVLRVGGGLTSGAGAGFWCFDGNNTSASLYSNVGLRLLWGPVGKNQDIQKQINNLQIQIQNLNRFIAEGGTQ